MRDEILREAFRLFGVTPRDILGNRRYSMLLPARFACYKALRERGWTLSMIGRAVGRHHTSVMHGIEKAEILAEREPAYAKKLRHLCTFDIAAARPKVEASPAKPSPAQPDRTFCDT